MAWFRDRVSVCDNAFGGGAEATHRLGWKAIPLARDDFDSNCLSQRVRLERLTPMQLDPTKSNRWGKREVSIP